MLNGRVQRSDGNQASFLLLFAALLYSQQRSRDETESESEGDQRRAGQLTDGREEGGRFSRDSTRRGV